MINSLKLWPAVTAFNFTFVDQHYRSVFAGVIAIGWQTYLSYLNRTAEKEEAVKKAVSGRDEKGGEEIKNNDTRKVEA